MNRAINQIKRARKVLKNNSIKYPDDHEIAKMTGLSLDRIRSASNCLRIVASMNQKMGDRGVSYMVKLKIDCVHSHTTYRYMLGIGAIMKI